MSSPQSPLGGWGAIPVWLLFVIFSDPINSIPEIVEGKIPTSQVVTLLPESRVSDLFDQVQYEKTTFPALDEEVAIKASLSKGELWIAKTDDTTTSVIKNGGKEPKVYELSGLSSGFIEVDDQGVPHEIRIVMSSKSVSHHEIVNLTTKESQKYTISDLPSWVDHRFGPPLDLTDNDWDVSDLGVRNGHIVYLFHRAQFKPPRDVAIFYDPATGESIRQVLRYRTDLEFFQRPDTPSPSQSKEPITQLIMEISSVETGDGVITVHGGPHPIVFKKTRPGWELAQRLKVGDKIRMDIQGENPLSLELVE